MPENAKEMKNAAPRSKGVHREGTKIRKLEIVCTFLAYVFFGYALKKGVIVMFVLFSKWSPVEKM
jgi:hypothetical protein